jgi:hypothetical protein
MPSLLPTGKQQYFDNAGVPLVGGKLYTYAAGTANPRATYADNQGVTPNPNPVILDGRGEAVVFWSGTYDVVLQDSLGNVIWSVQGVAESNLGARTSSTGAAVTPAGTTAQRDAVAIQGYMRYNVDLNSFEGYYGTWQSFVRSVGGVAIPDGGAVPLKTVGGVSLVGAGDIAVQSPLVSGVNIKTLAGVSILGAGDLTTSNPGSTLFLNANYGGL